MKLDQSLLERRGYHELIDVMYDVRLEQDALRDMVGRHIIGSRRYDEITLNELTSTLSVIVKIQYFLMAINVSSAGILIYLWFTFYRT